MTEAGAVFDLAHLRSWIGRTEEADDIVTPRLVGEYCATFAPHLAPVAHDQAPGMLQWVLAPPLAPAADLAADGHIKRGGFLPPVPLPRRMWAGGSVATHHALQVGATVRRISRIDDLSLKSGRTGQLCFVTVRHEYVAHGRVALTERQDIVYRDAAQTGGAPAAALRTQPTAEITWTVDPTEAMLFRYSALMFNAHRIHYDFPYVTAREGYAGLIVHGPLQGALLFNIAATLTGRAPASFDYRGLSPLIAGAPFTVHAARREGRVHCWTQNAAGATCMEADASQ